MHDLNQHSAIAMDQAVDRLVDGCVSQQDLPPLLARFEGEPDAWRRLALRFLEEQALSHELTALADTIDERSLISIAADATLPPPALPKEGFNGVLRARPGVFHSTAQWLAIAAGLVVAFGLGWSANAGRPILSRLRPEPEQVPALASAAAGIDGGLAAKASNPGSGWGVYSIAAGSAAQARDINVAAVNVDRVDAALLFDERSSIPASVAEKLRLSGHDIQRERRYFPLRLADGRQLILPVERVDVRYVGPVEIQ